MLDVLGAIVVGVAPIWCLIALLRLADARHRRRREMVERQIAVTDAIHRELGAVVAPVVRRWRRGTWRVLVAVPFDRPPVVERVLEIIHRTFQPGRYAIILTAQSAATAAGGTDDGRQHPLLGRAATRAGMPHRDRVASNAAA